MVLSIAWTTPRSAPTWVRLGLCPVCGTSVLVDDEFVRDGAAVRHVECVRYLSGRPARHLIELRGGPNAAAEARGWASSLDPLPGPEAELLLTELVTNAVRHGRAHDRQTVGVALESQGNRLRIAVSDPGPGFEWRPRPPGRPPEEGGYGLVLVDRIARRWGICRAAGRTTVWLELDLRPSC